MLHHDLTLAQRVLRDLVRPETRRIVIDSRENFQKLSAFAHEYMPQLAPLLSHYTGERPLFDLYGVEDEIQKALARRVDLKSGGYLIIDQTEAMTTIDVNTGGFVGVRNFDDTIFKTNLEAAQTIARQLRLRNLGGIIIVDFIDMEIGRAPGNAVLAELNKALARDHTRITVNGFTPARPGRDDPQAHARIAGPHALRDPARPAAAAARSRPPRPSPTRSCANCCARPASSTPANTACWPRRPSSTCSSTRNRKPWPCSPTSSASRSRCRPRPSYTQEQFDIVLDVNADPTARRMK